MSLKINKRVKNQKIQFKKKMKKERDKPYMG